MRIQLSPILGLAALLAILPCAASAEGRLCLRLFDNVRMQAIDDQHVLFVQRNGKRFESTLPNRCIGLSTDGFSFRSQDGEICGEAETLWLLRSAGSCQLGPIVPLFDTAKP